MLCLSLCSGSTEQLSAYQCTFSTDKLRYLHYTSHFVFSTAALVSCPFPAISPRCVPLPLPFPSPHSFLPPSLLPPSQHQLPIPRRHKQKRLTCFQCRQLLPQRLLLLPLIHPSLLPSSTLPPKHHPTFMCPRTKLLLPFCWCIPQQPSLPLFLPALPWSLPLDVMSGSFHFSFV